MKVLHYIFMKSLTKCDATHIFYAVQQHFAGDTGSVTTTKTTTTSQSEKAVLAFQINQIALVVRIANSYRAPLVIAVLFYCHVVSRMDHH
jgi:hypothetical protein